MHDCDKEKDCFLVLGGQLVLMKQREASGTPLPRAHIPRQLFIQGFKRQLIIQLRLSLKTRECWDHLESGRDFH